MDIHVLSNRRTPLTGTCRIASGIAKKKVVNFYPENQLINVEKSEYKFALESIFFTNKIARRFIMIQLYDCKLTNKGFKFFRFYDLYPKIMFIPDLIKKIYILPILDMPAESRFQ